MAKWMRCAACGQPFRSAPALQHHVEVEHDHANAHPSGPLDVAGSNPARCYLCGLVFENPAALARHDRWAHPEVLAAASPGPVVP